jgi:phytoene dehydrogenase-like protein
MTRRQARPTTGITHEDVAKYRLFYEIYPDLRWQPEDSSADWFEVALHAEMEEYQPPDHQKSREAVSVLMDVAKVLIQQVHSRGPRSIELSRAYFTLHPPALGDFTQTTLSRTLSIVFSNIGSYTLLREPSILTELKNQLNHLNVSRFQRSAETLCR